MHDPAASRVSAYFRFVLTHQVFVVGVVALVSVAAAYSSSRAVIASSLEKMFFGDSPAYQRYLDHVAEFGTEEVNVFAYREPSPLAAEAVARLRRIVDRLEAHPEVDRAFTLLDAQSLRGDAATIEIDPYVELARGDPGRIPELEAELIDDAFARGIVVSRDGQSVAVMVEIRPDPHRPAEVLPQIRRDIVDVFEAEGISGRALHSAGALVSINATVEATEDSIKRLFPWVLVVLLVTVWLLFRRLWPAILSGIVSLFGVLWTVGFAVVIDPEINIMISLVPVVILVVGFSDVVHLCSAYLLELGAGRDKEAAILASAEDVGRACMFTSSTTFVGFVCLSFIPTPMFRMLGVVLGFGVAVALALALTLVPVLFSWMPEPKPLRGGAAWWSQAGLDRALLAFERVAVGRAWWVIGAFVALGVWAAVGAARIEVESDFAAKLRPESDVRQDLRWFDAEFEGTSAIDVIVTTPEAGGLFDPERFHAIARLQDELAALPEVRRAMSLVDLMEELYAAYSPERAARERVPGTRAGLAQLLSLFEGGGGTDLDRMVDFERRTMRITLRVATDSLTDHAALAERIRGIAAETLPEDTEAEVTGFLFLLGDWVEEILAGQRVGLAVSFVVITGMMWLAVGRFGPAFVSMAPNLFPLLILGGWIGWFWDYVDSDTLIVALLAIGIGVDDTIHFLVRLRVEQERGLERDAALRRTFAFAGRAIVMTTIILGFGFLPLATSDYYSTRMIGELLPLCLVVAVVADLLLVPALAHVGWIDLAPRAMRSAP